MLYVKIFRFVFLFKIFFFFFLLISYYLLHQCNLVSNLQCSDIQRTRSDRFPCSRHIAPFGTVGQAQPNELRKEVHWRQRSLPQKFVSAICAKSIPMHRDLLLTAVHRLTRASRACLGRGVQSSDASKVLRSGSHALIDSLYDLEVKGWLLSINPENLGCSRYIWTCCCARIVS